MHYEGLKDRARHAERIEEMKLWFQLAHALRTSNIQIPASFLPKEEITNDINVVIGDLREVADLGAHEQPPLRFAFENLCWSTYFNTWEQVYDIVEKVDRPNFGICLDTFHIAGGVYGDPTSPTGRTPNADADLRESLARMIKTIDARKIVFVQIVDGEKMREPLVKGHAFHVDGQPPRMSWSRNARLFAFEESGYLPVMDVLRAIVEGLGYKGWLSMELFSRTMSDPAATVPREHARRAAESWKKIEKEMDGWNAR
jgi:4-hydroxyphenylpyruvate dioxygenase